MKKLTFILLAFIPFVAFGQYRVDTTVVEVPGSSAKTLSKSINIFTGKYFRENEVSYSDDNLWVVDAREPGTVMVFGSPKQSGWWEYEVFFEVKKGKYRFGVDNITYIQEGDGRSINYSKSNKEPKKTLKKPLNDLIARLKKDFGNIAIQKESSKDDW